MKVVHVLWSLGTGGIENMIAEIASCQAEMSKVAIVIVNDLIEETILKRINPKCIVYQCGRKPKDRNLYPIIKLNLFLFKFKPDIIHTHSLGTIKCVFYKTTYVRTIHNTYNKSIEYPKYSKLISISKSVYDFTKNQGFESVIVDNGINCKRIKQKVCYNKNGHLHFVQVGRLNCKQKGQDILIEALSLLEQKYGFSDFEMNFIGEGESRSLLEDMVKSKKLQDKVKFLGAISQPELYQSLCTYDLFIQPSRFEGFGLTVAEAIAARLPVLISNIEGPLEIIEGGRWGYTFKCGSAEELAHSLYSFVTEGYDEKMIDGAIERVMANYDVNVTARKYIDIYNSVL